MPATRKLAPSPDTADIQRRLSVALGHMHPGRTDFTLAEVMEALHVIGELQATESSCYYCGQPLESSQGQPKRRRDVDGWHLLHPACAQNWDNEGKR